jgi:cytochrome c biogenesis protein CcmG/thiol:disulfide interchange protein DsbE
MAALVSRPRTRRIAMAVVAAAAIAALALFGLAGKGAGHPRAPALPRQALSGHAVTLAQLRGHPAFVVFWASWCTPCHHEAPAIERFARSVAGRVAVVGVDWSDPATARARAFIRDYGWTFSSLQDPDGAVGDHYGLTGLPTTYLLDNHGRIAATLAGEQTQDSLQRALRAL